MPLSVPHMPYSYKPWLVQHCFRRGERPPDRLPGAGPTRSGVRPWPLASEPTGTITLRR